MTAVMAATVATVMAATVMTTATWCYSHFHCFRRRYDRHHKEDAVEDKVALAEDKEVLVEDMEEVLVEDMEVDLEEVLAQEALE